MSQSKLSLSPIVDPIISLGSSYSRALSANPLLVKSITSGLLAAIGNYIAQRMSRQYPHAKINLRTIRAFGIYGLFVTGPCTHFFLNWLDRHGPGHPMLKLLIDRFLYGPIFLAFALYALSRLEGTDHLTAEKQLRNVYWSALKKMWKVWIIVQYINLNFVPLQYRVLVANVVSVGWNVILSRTRSSQKKITE